MSMYYAGIGSRETPEYIMKLMEQMSAHLAREGCILRSGGAKGADQAFERGCDREGGEKEIYIPWEGFESSTSKLIGASNKACQIAEEYHPYWQNLSNGARKLQARNSHQVLGKDLQTPSSFVICYTKGGKGAGGTGQAIRIAKANRIPIFDCGKYSSAEKIKEEYRIFLRMIRARGDRF